MSHSFSLNRVKLLTQKYLCENRRSLQMHLGVYFGILLLVNLLILKSVIYPRDGFFAIFFMDLFFLSFAMVISGSRVFEYFSTKQKRIAQLMVPASRTEKFVSQMFICIILGNIILFAATFLAGFISSLLFPSCVSCLPPVNHDMTSTEVTLLIEIIIGTLLYLIGGQALYVLGSALWPRKAFFKTFVALMVLQIIVPLLIPFRIFDFFGSSIYSYNHSDNTTLQIAIVEGVVFIFILGLYALAWWRINTTRLMQKFY